MLPKKVLLWIGFILSFATRAFAADTLDTGDTAWVTMSTALVMMMTPAGLALFYGGMSRYKNLLNTIAMTLVAYCVASIVWVGWGYSLAFGESSSLFIGNLKHIFLSGIDINSLSGTIPTILFVVFQMTFACISVAIILGSVVDRMKFSSWIVFTILWVTFVYAPVCNWAWGGGWMHHIGALDFAGGNVVHINAGVSGLVLALMIGKRKGYGKEAMIPSSVAFTSLGAGLLWFGWFGFNAGSALGANGLAASAFLTTNTAAAMGGIAWLSIEWIHSKKPTLLGLASGAIAGLVGITPAAGFVTLGGAFAIGAVSGHLGYFGVAILKKKLGYDDSLDAFGIHGLCGMWGAIATGIFVSPIIADGTKGLIYGNPKQVWIQFLSIIGTAAFSAVATFIVVMVTKMLTNGIRVDNEDEFAGLDNALHGERAFEIE
ncbi:MAG: ammonium transporter [Proteobacteria bacterium]|nr:ammonium transporter [Pseudomonadota bacterium]MBU1389972.1 ammonium transporter [Pseudomonadota bacterium]MBU1545077.1 ammonium transporter [Pseudomonadota bacterium]MBU2431510.1 ammonium transporter [Pseudomonadota bacterium]MBU2480878.1 ammonium transporter [Pseudomonadota bacterium]